MENKKYRVEVTMVTSHATSVRGDSTMDVDGKDSYYKTIMGFIERGYEVVAVSGEAPHHVTVLECVVDALLPEPNYIFYSIRGHIERAANFLIHAHGVWGLDNHKELIIKAMYNAREALRFASTYVDDMEKKYKDLQKKNKNLRKQVTDLKLQLDDKLVVKKDRTV